MHACGMLSMYRRWLLHCCICSFDGVSPFLQDHLCVFVFDRMLTISIDLRLAAQTNAWPSSRREWVSPKPGSELTKILGPRETTGSHTVKRCQPIPFQRQSCASREPIRRANTWSRCAWPKLWHARFQGPRDCLPSATLKM